MYPNVSQRFAKSPHRRFTCDKDMPPIDMTNKYKVSTFLYLHNDINKIMLLPNVGPGNHPWDPGQSWDTPQPGGEHTKETLGQPPPCPIQVGVPI